MNDFQLAILDLMGSPKYRYTGKDVVTHCPVCGDSYDGDKLYIQKNGYVHCFVCDTASKGVKQFLTKFLDTSYKDAVEYEKEYNLDKSVTTSDSEDDNLFTELISVMSGESSINNSPVPVSLPRNALKITDSSYSSVLYDVVKYITSRGVTKEQADKFNIMYTSGDTVMTNTGKIMAIPESVIFPAYDTEGRQIYWNTRSLPGKSLLKAINAPSIPNVSYSTENTVWNLNNMTSNSNIIIVESVFNALTIDRAGFDAVATYGKGISSRQLEMIASLRPNSVVVYLDTDGIDKALKYAKFFNSKGINTRYVDSPYENLDANDLGYRKVREVMQKYCYKYSIENILETISKHNLIIF